MSVRGVVGTGLFLALMMVTSSTLGVEPAQQEDGSKFLDLGQAHLRISVDRTKGLVPMKVKISSELRGVDPDAELAPDHHVFVEVESSYVRIIGGETESALDHGGLAELDSAGVKDPMQREIVIKTPGTYRFRVIVRDEDGHEVVSNKVQVKAM